MTASAVVFYIFAAITVGSAAVVRASGTTIAAARAGAWGFFGILSMITQPLMAPSAMAAMPLMIMRALVWNIAVSVSGRWWLSPELVQNGPQPRWAAEPFIGAPVSARCSGRNMDDGRRFFRLGGW